MADRSLDDIIKERKLSANRRGRGRFQGTKRNFNGGRAGQNQVVATGVKSRLGNSNGRLGNSNVRLGNTQHLTDARDKLIAKARKTDAREKLIQKARQTDARARINAKRVKTGPKGDDDSLPHNVKIGGLKRTVSNKGQKTQSIQLSVQNDVPPPTQFTVHNTSAERFTVRNTVPELFTVRNTSSATHLSSRKPISPPRESASSDNFKIVVSNSGRDKFQSSGRLTLGSIQHSPPTKPAIMLRQRPAMDNPRLGFESSTKVQRSVGNTLDTGGPLRLTSTPRVRPSVDGTRVVISNLQSTVTEEDIKELFGALGVLKRVRMVKQGLAEVIYSKRESALKAISTYHNRELDGKAMQCRLDTSSVAEPFKKNTISDRFKTYSSANNPSLPYRSTIPATTVVELEDEIIDKVLFKLPVMSSSTSKPVIFTVKI